MTDPLPTPPADDPLPYTPVALRPRRDGWTADRQRTFLRTLAETGCVTEACSDAAVSPRSAYRLRTRPEGATFAEAWDKALGVAAHRLVTLAFDRAINGTVEEIWKEGVPVGHRRQPSDKLLMFLLRNLDCRRFGFASESERRTPADPGRRLDALLDRLADDDQPADAESSWPAPLPDPVTAAASLH